MKRPGIKHASVCSTRLLAVLANVSASGACGQGLQDRKIRQLRQRIDELLRTELTGRWVPRAVDRELGGFHQKVFPWRRKSDGANVAFRVTHPHACQLASNPFGISESSPIVRAHEGRFSGWW